MSGQDAECRAEFDARCPDCGRTKAKTADDVRFGACEKWWAIRDPEARVECDAISSFMNARSRPTVPAGEAECLTAEMAEWASRLITLAPDGNESVSEAQRKADQFLYALRAIASGRSRVVAAGQRNHLRERLDYINANPKVDRENRLADFAKDALEEVELLRAMASPGVVPAPQTDWRALLEWFLEHWSEKYAHERVKAALATGALRRGNEVEVMTPFNQLTAAEAERLALLLEELGEAQQAIGKILRHGYASHNPDQPFGPSNRMTLEREMGDVAAALQLMTDACDLDRDKINRHGTKKLEKVQQYLHHQERTPNQKEGGNG